jgi:hypothetical protein
VINERQAVERLVAICPGFAPHWLRYLSSWEGTPSGEYNHMGALAEWVVSCMAIGELDCFSMLFEEVESLLVGASTDVRNVLVIGLLEDIQYMSVDRRVGPDIALRFLGPESRKEWFDLVRTVHRDWPGKSREDG